MAGLALPVVFADAVEVIERVDTAPAILTRVSAALVHVWWWRRRKRERGSEGVCSEVARQ